MAAKPKQHRPRRQPPPQIVVEAAPEPVQTELTPKAERSLAEAIADAFGPWGKAAGAFLAVGALMTALWSFWNWGGGARLVTNYHFDQRMADLEIKLSDKIDKSEARVHADVVKLKDAEVKQNVRINRLVIANLETLGAALYFHKLNLEDRMRSVEFSLRSKPKDEALITRKGDIENWAKANEEATRKIADEIAKLKKEYDL